MLDEPEEVLDQGTDDRVEEQSERVEAKQETVKEPPASTNEEKDIVLDQKPGELKKKGSFNPYAESLEEAEK